jgi:hypothetical protein
MEHRTRISLRRFMAFVTYIAVVFSLIVPSRDAIPFSQPLSWVYDNARAVPPDVNVVSAWSSLVCGTLLLVGTTAPFFLIRWWTVLPAILCGVLYVAIGFAEAVYQS